MILSSTLLCLENQEAEQQRSSVTGCLFGYTVCNGTLSPTLRCAGHWYGFIGKLTESFSCMHGCQSCPEHDQILHNMFYLLYHVSSPSPNLPLAVQLGLFMHSQNFLVLIIMYRWYLGTCYISMHMQGIINAYMHIRA